jgi:hypothetical protein
MSVIGFNFTSIEAKKDSSKAVAQKGMQVNHSISISNVTKVPLNMSETQSEVLKVEFDFSVLYKELGAVKLSGDALYSDTKEIIEESAKEFENSQKLPEMVDLNIRKFVYNKSLMQAMNMSDLLNLPSPIPLPKFEKKKKEE